jgi:hypothetical protein
MYQHLMKMAHLGGRATGRMISKWLLCREGAVDGDGFQMWKVAGNILKTQLQTV